MRAVVIAALTGVALVAAGSVTGQPATPLGPAEAPAWRVGDEWSYRWESPRGKGAFTWVVQREETLDGVAYWVTRGGGREVSWRKSDLGFHQQTTEGSVDERAVPPRRDYAWPLAAGKTWEQTYTRERPAERQTEEVKITYRNERGGTQQTTGRLPWELAFDARAGHFLYVSAQNQEASGSIACDILIDGVSRATATSTGAYVVAECSEAAEP